ncbi:MAG: ABC transporter ATP-binding protein [Clostridium sp.]|uniref:ABC transporter ATP-binding protein n=1 Tax=Clostridium culturomicium TaxID=1499683 RepID=UPI00290B9534|nr:ABC transporter ATP-binding protein [Clostridium sp.]MDU7083725.1 ABC transporter ATP-binding protein [Clostridium sp.]
MALLEVENLKTYFDIEGKKCTAVDGISFVLNKGETMAVIGESGSGKSVTALSIMGLIDYPGKIAEGKIIFNGEDLLKKKENEIRKIRGNEIAMIYQDPMTTLNPMNKVGEQIGEALIIHKKNKKNEIKPIVIDLMKAVGIMDAEERYNQLPDQFSGGMRQRLMIAMAIACKPKLLIADEPTTALDVTIQAEILDLLRNLKSSNDMSIILNTHDLGVVAEMADKVIVMYCGKIMEMTSNEELFNNPLNPYTKKLMECIPRVDDKKRRLQTIDGYVPYLTQLPKGCRFSNRCEYATDKCKAEVPELIEVEEGHWSRCWYIKI